MYCICFSSRLKTETCVALRAFDTLTFLRPACSRRQSKLSICSSGVCSENVPTRTDTCRHVPSSLDQALWSSHMSMLIFCFLSGMNPRQMVLVVPVCLLGRQGGSICLTSPPYGQTSNPSQGSPHRPAGRLVFKQMFAISHACICEVRTRCVISPNSQVHDT